MPTQFPAFLSTDAQKIGMSPIAARLAIYWQFPSGTLPVAIVKEDEQKFEEKLFNDIFTKEINDTMKGSEGMPMGLEIIGKPFNDEKVLAIMKILEEKFKFKESVEFPTYA